MWARMTCPTRFDLACSNTEQMTLVLEHTPQFASHGRIGAPIPKTTPDTSATPFGFERGQIFSTDEPTIAKQCQQDQQIRGQLSEFAISPLTCSPAVLTSRAVHAHPRLPPSKM